MYRGYPGYKNPSIDLIGKIPDHWTVKRLKYVSPNVTVGVVVNPSTYVDDNGTVPFLRGVDVSRDEIATDNVKKMSEASNAINAKSTLREGDLVSMRVGYPGVTAVIPKELDGANCASLLIIRRPSELSSRLLCYQINTDIGINQIKLLQQGAAQEQINVSDIVNFWVVCPPENEAISLERFLDHETAKIDTLIEKQQQLIKLLKEKRQAVISHAVTKGLNPNAPMRDSGVEWLGDVPEGWEMVPLKYLCNFSGGGTPSKDNLSYWTGGDIPWVSPKDMKSFWVSDTQDKLTEKAVEESSTNFVETGALLMVVRSGILQRTIPIAINTVRVTLNQDMKALKFNERINTEYAANYIVGNVSSLLLEWSKEGATVESIEQDYLSGSLIPVPPKEEQDAINEKIKKRIADFKDLEIRAVKGIALLQERRTALISAAVTGKIDVRNWVAPEPSNMSNNKNKEVAP